MSSRNLAILVGRVGSEPKYSQTQSGSVANFSLATSEKWVDHNTGNKQERTEWHNIVVWNQKAEFVSKYVHKGDPLYVEGSIQSREYEDKTGRTRKVTEIKARSVQKLGGKSTDEPKQERSYELDDRQPSFTDDDIPF